MGGAMSTTGVPTAHPSSPARRSATRARALHLAIGLLAALRQASITGKGQYVEVAMMDGVMNLCRVKFRDHQRLTRQSLAEYSVPTYQGMGDVPRAGQRLGRRPARQRHPLQAARRERLALRRGAGGRMGRSPRSASGGSGVSRSPPTARGASAERYSSCVTLLNKFAEKVHKRELMAILNPSTFPAGRSATRTLLRRPRDKGRDMWSSSTTRSAASGTTSACRSSSRFAARIERSPLLGEHTERGSEGSPRLRRREDRRP